MKFIYAGGPEATTALVKQLRAALEGDHQVLWFFSGGSNIPLAVQAMRQLPEELTQRLTIMPIDERYGSDGHADSNSAQLLAAGFDVKQAQLIPVLNGSNIEETTKHFESNLAAAFAANDVVIGQLGMGSDGHISGILPHSPAASATTLATYYQGHDYLRITTTFSALEHLTVGCLFAFGENKREQLQRLRDENPPLIEQPAQILKALPEAYVYNDQLKERDA
jgi:6-phosphogluconolactonase/glucosamine-6-phosphate isomerase/deaminase